jgi:hypothetical protein
VPSSISTFDVIQRTLLLLLGAFAAITAAEVVLRALPVSTATNTGYYLTPNILNYPPHHQWTVATGWDLRDVQQMRSNNMGFAAEHDFVAGSDAVGLVGDSYVEASMLPLADRPAAQLERALDGRLVYAMGGPGTALLDYAERIQWAYQTLGLRTFVVMMQAEDASQTLCGSGNIHALCLLPDTLEPAILRQPSSGWVKGVLRHSSLAQYLNSQLKFKPSRLTSPDFWRAGVSEKKKSSTEASVVTPPQALAPKKMRTIDASVDSFFKQVDVLEGVHLIFVIDMNRDNLEHGINQPDEAYHFAMRLRERGQTVVQGEPLYRKHQRQSPLRLSVGPHDGHLNKIGVALLMDATAEIMKKTE